MNDLTIGESFSFRKLEKIFLNSCGHFGYDEVKTATIEPLYIFTGLGAFNETKLKRIYSFIDWDGWSGERVALKPDSTACIARFYGENLYNVNSRQKLCYVENHFEWADTWDGISERWQCGVENIATSSSESDIEVIYMAYDIIQKLGVKNFYLHLSYPSIVNEIGKEFLEKNAKNKECLFNITDEGYRHHSVNYLENIKNGLKDSVYKNIKDKFENFISICKGLDKIGCKYIIDFNQLGDLEYYSGIQFQILSSPKRKSRNDVLCSGGRYDNFIADMLDTSHPIPTVGFALYARNILNLTEIIEQRSELDNRQNICIKIQNITKDNLKTAQKLCSKFSDIGFFAKIFLDKIEDDKFNEFGLALEVDHEKFNDGYQILYSQKIGKPLLKNLFGEFNER